MKTAVMDEIMRQRDLALKEALEASLAGDVARAFRKLGENVAEAKPTTSPPPPPRALAGGARQRRADGPEPRAA